VGGGQLRLHHLHGPAVREGRGELRQAEGAGRGGSGWAGVHRGAAAAGRQGRRGGKPAACEKFKVAPAAFKKLGREAGKVQFEDGSREEKFVREKIEALARQIIGVANRFEPEDGEAQAADRARVAVALLRRLKEALEDELVVTEEEPAPQAEPQQEREETLEADAAVA
jgi:hypothetical protein